MRVIRWKLLPASEHRSNYIQNPDRDWDCRSSDDSRLWRGVARDLDAVSSVSAEETFRSYRMAAGNDPASSRQAGPIDRQRSRQRACFATDRFRRDV